MSREGINHGIKNRAAELALAHSSDGRLISQSPYCDDDDGDDDDDDDDDDGGDDDGNTSTFVWRLPY